MGLKVVALLLLLFLCVPAMAVEFRPQLTGLLPVQIEKFYQHLSKDELSSVSEAMRMEHANFYNQVTRLNAIDRQLAKDFFKAFDDFNQKMISFSKTSKSFYFWRVLHLINDLLVFDATEPNLNKFVSDVLIEWEFLDAADQAQLRQSFPEFVDRIKSVDFQIFAAEGRKLWSVDRFTHPSN